jgi:hypothetical protein
MKEEEVSGLKRCFPVSSGPSSGDSEEMFGRARVPRVSAVGSGSPAGQRQLLAKTAISVILGIALGGRGGCRSSPWSYLGFVRFGTGAGYKSEPVPVALVVRQCALVTDGYRSRLGLRVVTKIRAACLCTLCSSKN